MESSFDQGIRYCRFIRPTGHVADHHDELGKAGEKSEESVRRFYLSAALLLSSGGGGAFSQDIPLIGPGTPYSVSRDMLVARGFQPLLFPKRPDRCSWRAEICEAYPEAEACAGIRSSLCRFVFRKGSQIIVVSAVGEQVESLSVAMVVPLKGPDAKSYDELDGAPPKLSPRKPTPAIDSAMPRDKGKNAAENTPASSKCPVVEEGELACMPCGDGQSYQLARCTNGALEPETACNISAHDPVCS